MRKKLPVLILALIILLQVFVPAVYAASKNEVISSTPSFCSMDTTPEGAGKTLKLPETQFTTKKLQHEFKHASDYGITGNWNNTNKATFENAIRKQINSVKNPISGTYRGNMEVYHFYDAKTRLNTMIDKSGNFVGGWKLSADQIANLLRSGNIQ